MGVIQQVLGIGNFHHPQGQQHALLHKDKHARHGENDADNENHTVDDNDHNDVVVRVVVIVTLSTILPPNCPQSERYDRDCC